MSRTKDILDKTKRKEPEAKKWKVIVGIVVGLVFGGALFVGGYVVTEPVSDSYFKSKSIVQHSEFYKSQTDSDNISVYFIGSSVIGTAVYCPLIDSILSDRGYDVETYNLHLGADIPRIRAMEVDWIIESNPSLVVYGITYYDITREDIWYDHVAYSPNSPLDNDNLTQFYSCDELKQFIERTYFSKKGYFVRGFPHYLTSTLNTESYHEKTLYYIKEGYSPDTLRNNELYHKDINDIQTTARDVYSVMTLNSDSARYNGAALVSNIKKLTDANIPVILISIPIHPIVHDALPKSTVSDYHFLLDQTGNNWINAETIFDDSCFYDQFHKTWHGCQLFSNMMADLIIQELS